MAKTLSIRRFPILVLLFLVRPSQTMNNIVMDGLAKWKDPTIYVGDSLVFKRKHHRQKLYLFYNRKAFDLCSFSQATLIYDGSKATLFMLLPFTIFSLSGILPAPVITTSPFGTALGGSCEAGEKLTVRVITPDTSPGFAPTLVAPPPTAGGDFPYHGWAISSPSYTPTPAPEAASSPSSPLEPRNGHAPSPVSSDGGIPFISSNPAVPLPIGETDSATILPLPSPEYGNQVFGQSSILRVEASSLVFVMMSSFGLVVDSYFHFGAFV